MDLFPTELKTQSKQANQQGFGNDPRNLTPEGLFDNLNNVIGRPYSFLDNTDPKGRTFARHMVPASPLVMIRPGRIKFSESPNQFIKDALTKFGVAVGSDADVDKVLKGGKDSAGKPGGGTLFGGEYGVTAADKAAIEAAIAEKTRGTVGSFDISKHDGSIRYFDFSSTPTIQREYQSVLSTLSGRIYSRMKGETIAWADIGGKWDPGKLSNGGFYTFWADNASSVSESASSNVGATKLAGLVKGVSEISREAQFFLGSNLAGGATEGQRAGAVDGAIKGIADYIGAGDSGGLRASLGDAILGMNPMFPEVWKDSSFSRSYNLSFKFFSPYGAPAAIYQNVLQPFMMLMSLVFPVEANPGVYTEPFIFQVDCPGYFACDLGICTDFSFVKGGADNLWTVDGLPRQIDVTMSVRDLYPVLVASKNNQSMYFNVGMGTFLDNLAGISLFKGNAGEGDLIQRTRANINSTLGQARAIPGQLVSAGQVFLENSTPIPGIFRSFRDR
jgi:hypothetical protein